MSTSDILESLIEKDNGYLITSKAVESGVSKPAVSKYVREHDMEKVAHGVYESLAEVGSNGEYCGGLINLKFR